MYVKMIEDVLNEGILLPADKIVGLTKARAEELIQEGKAVAANPPPEEIPKSEEIEEDIIILEDTHE